MDETAFSLQNTAPSVREETSLSTSLTPTAAPDSDNAPARSLHDSLKLFR